MRIPIPLWFNPGPLCANYPDSEQAQLLSSCHRICISPQCGFASSAAGNPVTEQDVVDKLSLVVKTAKEVWADA